MGDRGCPNPPIYKQGGGDPDIFGYSPPCSGEN